MTSRTSKLPWLLLAGAAMMPGQALAQAAASQEPSVDNSGLSEIIVTAQRREERSQDVPILITALTNESLRERGVTDLQGLQNLVPSLVVAPNGQTARDVMSPSIRGQSASFQGAPAVVVYMNEIPLPTAIGQSRQGGPGNFTDLQNLQVLSGAQGTLFGRNTTGGAVMLTPTKPTDRLEGYLQGGFGNYNMAEFEAVLNVPVTDTLRVRLVGATRDRDGFSYDVNWNKARDDQHTRMGRIGVLWEPAEGVTSYTMAYYGFEKSNGTGIVPHKLDIDKLRGFSNTGWQFNLPNLQFCTSPLANPASDCSAVTKLITDQAARGNRKVAHGVDDFSEVETWGISNSTDLNLTDNLKLRNIISYATLKSSYASDADGTTLSILDSGMSALSRAIPRDDYQLFTEELQLQGQAFDNKLTYTFGGFYAKQSPNGVMKSYSVTVCALPASLVPTTCGSSSETTNTNESKALFGQVTLDLGALTPALDNLRLTGGYRYTWDRVSGSAINYSPAIGVGGNVTCSFNGARPLRVNANNLVTDAVPGCGYESTLKSSSPNWTLGVDYRPINNLLLYGKVTRGYKAGGFNQFAVFLDYATFNPEYVTDWEFGFKSDFKIAGRPVRLNVNGFNMDYTNIQRSVPDFNPATGKSGAIVLSSASAVIRGVEVQLTAKPVDILEIGGNFSHIDSHYKSFSYKSATPVWDCSATSTASPKTLAPNLTCLPLPYISPYIFSVYGRLAVPTSEKTGDISLFVSYAWTDKQETAPGTLQEFKGTTNIWEPGVRLPSYGLLTASVDWKNLLSTGLDLSIFGTNLTNKQYVISNSGIYNVVGAHSNILGEPRMYGLRLKYKFGN